MPAIAVALLQAVDLVLRETMLFAGIALLIGGLDDLLVDLVHGARRALGRERVLPLDALPATGTAGRMAIFVPAWDESAVIGAMLSTALARIDHPDYRIFVGCYPNDRATIAIVADVAARDSRVRLVIGERDGPTTKADCLNALWRALRRDDAIAARDTLAVVLHDAEDVIPRAGLRVLDALARAHAAVQLPVMPLIAPAGRWVSGHYADEFAESHGRVLPVRVALGAAMPLAGVGCAIRVDALARLADAHGDPFDADSLTEDYELGLRLGANGAPARFARYRDGGDGRLVAVRAYFPMRLHSAVVQKARWTTGIALAGWDRIGWGRWHHLGEHWMRMRDRRAPLAVLTILVGYVALLCWVMSIAGHAIAGTPAPRFDPALDMLLSINAALMLWRLAMRALATGGLYGWREGLRAIPRAFVANLIAVLAVRHAIDGYVRRRGRSLRWDKTAHVFPDAETIGA